MASTSGCGAGRYTYTLNGFGRDLDRCPMVFLEPFSASRVCSLCAVVPEQTALLPCRDVVCRTCYDRCREMDVGACPLHTSMRINPDDIEWRVLPLSEVSKRKAWCWNAKNGCPVVTEAWDMAEHCYGACQYYNVTCMRCQKKVLQKDVVEHLRDGCSSNILRQTLETAPEDEPHDDSFEEARGAWLNGNCDDVTSAMPELLRTLRRLLNENASLRDEIRSVQEHVTHERKHCQAVLTQCFEGVKLETLSAMKDHGSEANNWHNGTYYRIKEDMAKMSLDLGQQLDLIAKENVEYHDRLQEHVAMESASLLKVATKTLQFASSVPNFQEWVVRGWTAFKGMATAQGKAWSYSEPRYFLGYHLFPALLVSRDGEDKGLKVHAGLELKKGTNDAHLEWPFRRSCRITFIHPREKPRARSLTLTPDLEVFASKLARPDAEVTTAGQVYSLGNFCHARDLENEGYVSADEIRVRFEVMF
ncbi:TNF receptor-associated factor 3-like [Dermacentor albipictus]|uniref:TNF receptor-associated factor 3-like n=1 Tax=Dermacentor albipictus TaxID=60249 RepID=UPI0038FCC06C